MIWRFFLRLEKALLRLQRWECPCMGLDSRQVVIDVQKKTSILNALALESLPVLSVWN